MGSYANSMSAVTGLNKTNVIFLYFFTKLTGTNDFYTMLGHLQ